ncbi:MAG: putative bacteriocin export ABC transporter [Streptococcaceae bacterium]|jgi:putative ABC transport system ATP-binding protein|nr:putative bacteriocin export ABC transporter [Streptococcaceae bacterium]
MPLIKIKNLTKKYHRKTIFQNYNIDIPENKFIVIRGVSGAGKTTLLNIIGMLEDYDDGEYYLFDALAPLVNSRKAVLYRRQDISYLFQNFALIEEDSVEKNLELSLSYVKISAKQKRIKMRQALADVNLSHSLKTKVYSLSGGEKQKVALAQVLLKDSKLILADEPTGSLDEKNRNEILALLKKETQKGKTVVVVSHDPVIVCQADEVIEIGKD